MPAPYRSFVSKSHKHQAGSLVQVAAAKVPSHTPEYVILPRCVVVSTVALLGIADLDATNQILALRDAMLNCASTKTQPKQVRYLGTPAWRQ